MNAIEFVQDVLERVEQGRFSGFHLPEFSSRVMAKIRQILARRLPLNLVFEAEECTCSGGCPVCHETWVHPYTRDLPAQGLQTRGLHVVNGHVEDVVEYVEVFRQISGEVCFSREVDDHFHRRGEFLGVVVDGYIVAGYNTDVWSDTCPLTGRRVLGDRTGAARVEDWVVPRDAQLVRVVTSCREFLRQLDMAGIPAEPWTGCEPDPVEWDRAAEWDRDWR